MSNESIQEIVSLAKSSPVRSHYWTGRGPAPGGYVDGWAMTFAGIHAEFKQGNKFALEMGKANTHNPAKDALSWYAGKFVALGMSNDVAGVDTLRHAAVLAFGLGMRESSGQWWCGWDTSSGRNRLNAATAESGLFQVSDDSEFASPLLPELIDTWKDSGLAQYFKGSAPHGIVNYGSGRGAQFQALCKSDPSFAIWYAMVLLRNLRPEWGPLNTYAAEVLAIVDAFLLGVQKIVDAS